MSGAPHDKELVEYRHEIGNEEYTKQYYSLYMKARNSKERYSGKTYTNSEERLEEIRNKYKNGVTKEILNEFMEKI